MNKAPPFRERTVPFVRLLCFVARREKPSIDAIKRPPYSKTIRRLTLSVDPTRGGESDRVVKNFKDFNFDPVET